MKIYLTSLIALLLLFSCNRPQRVELGSSCLSNINVSYFRGIAPDIQVDVVYKILGRPDEEIEIEDEDDPGIDLAYYTDQGRLLLHWSGNEEDPVGMIEFRPKNNLTIENLINQNLVVQKNHLKLECNGSWKLDVYFNEDNRTIKEVYWWFK